MSRCCFATATIKLRPFPERADDASSAASQGRGHIWQRPDLSEQSDGAGEASHANLGAQRVPGGRQGGEGRSADGG